MILMLMKMLTLVELFMMCSEVTAHPVMIDSDSTLNDVNVYYDSVQGRFVITAVTDVLEMKESLSTGEAAVIIHGNVLPEKQLPEMVEREEQPRLNIKYQLPEFLMYLSVITVFLSGFTVGLGWSVYYVRQQIPITATPITVLKHKK